MSVVVIALDRYLLMCHGYFTTWSKTCGLLLICWFFALILPSLVILILPPDGILLANGAICHPNFTSRDPIISGLLGMSLSLILLALAIVVFCYANVFLKYQSMLRRKECGGEMNQAEHAALSPKSAKLLKKLFLITANFLLTFAPFATSFFVMMATKAELDDHSAIVVIMIYLIGLLMNPILIYLLDAKMQRSVNDLLCINKIIPKKEPKSIQHPRFAAVLKANVLQLTSPIAMSPSTNTQQIPPNVNKHAANTTERKR